MHSEEHEEQRDLRYCANTSALMQLIKRDNHYEILLYIVSTLSSSKKELVSSHVMTAKDNKDDIFFSA